MGGGWALVFESFLGPVKWHETDRRVPFGDQKTFRFVKKITSCFLFQEDEESNPLPEEEYFQKVHDFREPSIHYVAPAKSK